jgi:hypothetical protein
MWGLRVVAGEKMGDLLLSSLKALDEVNHCWKIVRMRTPFIGIWEVNVWEKKSIDAELTFDVGEQQLGHRTADLVIQGADHNGERIQ